MDESNMEHIRQKIKKIPLYLSIGFLIANLLFPALHQGPILGPALIIYLILFIEFALLIFLTSLSFALFEKPADLLAPTLATSLLIVYLFVGFFQLFMDNQLLANSLDILVLLIIPQVRLAFDV